MNIGILFPRSGVYPGIGMEFMDGMKLWLKERGLNEGIQYTAEAIGFGGAEKEVYEKAEKMLVIDGVDILVAYIDLKVIELLEPLVYSTGKLMIVVNPGANYPSNWVPQPGIIHLTLQQSFHCWLTGLVAASRKDANAAMASSFYDCGYLHTAALANGFMSEGGQIRYNYINNEKYDESFHIKPLNDFLATDKEINTIIAIYDTKPSALFYRALNQHQRAEELSLFVSPMMLDEKALQSEGAFNFSIEGHSAWHGSNRDAGNNEFYRSHQENGKKSPTIFSMLGWEAGMLIGSVIQHANDQRHNAVALIEKLASIKFESPAGEMKLDPETHFILKPVYKYTAQKGQERGNWEKLDFPLDKWNKFSTQTNDEISSGWTNTYLCY